MSPSNRTGFDLHFSFLPRRQEGLDKRPKIAVILNRGRVLRDIKENEPMKPTTPPPPQKALCC